MEPPTTAKVILQTTRGPIEIELWAKETPLTCRNFIQLCINGYYDNCKFHRVIKDFIVQSGDPSGSGYGGSSIYDKGVFKDEFHSRLKFNRRGIVGSANKGEKDSNGSQFIISLSAAPELNNKNTIFGRVVGETFYNVLKISEGEVDGEIPLYPVIIESTEVVVPYFDDLEKPVVIEKKEVVKSVKRKRAKVKIAYDDEDEEETLIFKLKPAHDLLRDKKLQKERGKEKLEKKEEEEEEEKEEEKQEEKQEEKEKEDEKKEEKERELSRESTKEITNTSTNTTKKNITTKRPHSPSPLPTKSKLSKQDREKNTLELLKKFQNKVKTLKSKETSPSHHNPVSTYDNTWNSDDELPSDYEEEIDDSTGLWTHTFQASSSN